MHNLQITKEQARKFMLYKQGLIGEYRFAGKDGILDFVRQAGCIQYDPIDVCGKNSELVLQSRVKGFAKHMLYELLYTERVLVDYFDKNLSIFSVEDWKYFERFRIQHQNHERSHAEIDEVCDEIKEIIRNRGAVCSSDLNMNEKIHWYWSRTSLSRAALEHMYFLGELAIHHKKGTIKYYDLIENCISPEILSESDPYPDEHEHMKWRVLRRIGAVGLLWNKASDAWLNISGLKTAQRNKIFAELINENKIFETEVEGVKDKLYFLSEDREIFDYVLKNPKLKSRCEFLAPLDNMLWDRKLIKELFGFDYKWEIYTPKPQRKYGYYVLPVLYGDVLIGRIEAACNRKNKEIVIKNIWYEDNVKRTKKLTEAIDQCVGRFAEFNDCPKITSS